MASTDTNVSIISGAKNKCVYSGDTGVQAAG